MLRPEFVLRRFHALSDDAGLRRVRLHDCLHLAASQMIAAGVPMAAVSKALRQSRSRDHGGHLLAPVA